MPTVESQGISIHFEEVGSGLPVILGHSFLCDGTMWAPQVPALSEEFRVINVDCRGHGRSGRVEKRCSLYDLVADQLAVLDHLGIERAVWAGLSIWRSTSLRSCEINGQVVAGTFGRAGPSIGSDDGDSVSRPAPD